MPRQKQPPTNEEHCIHTNEGVCDTCVLDKAIYEAEQTQKFYEMEIALCKKCMQMTNHIGDKCQKCKRRELIASDERIVDDVIKEAAIQTTATLENEFFKGKFSSGSLCQIEAIIQKVFNIYFHEGVKVVYKYDLLVARADEREKLLNQKANAHDQEVRRQVGKEILEALEEKRPNGLDINFKEDNYYAGIDKGICDSRSIVSSLISEDKK